jgi:hypothetical protein
VGVRRLALVALAASLCAAPGFAATRTAQVRVTNISPVVVRGTGFVARERVTVTVSAKTSRTRVVTATAAGSLVARFAHFTIGRCDAYAVKAKGSAGSRAFWKIAPMCAPATPGGDQTQAEPKPLEPTDPTPKKR